jgi:NAD(P)H-quinone oxidoreductase subunit 6
MIETIGFWVFATLAVLGALGVVFHRSLIYAALLLIVVFLSIAGVFVLNNADFLAIAQVIVYGVGLTIIVLFGIMFTGDRLLPDERQFTWQKGAFGLIALSLFAVIVKALQYPFVIQPHSQALITVLQTEGTTKLLGQYLLTKQLLPFELASVLLLVAMIGAILIAKKHFYPVGQAEVSPYTIALRGESVSSTASVSPANKEVAHV